MGATILIVDHDPESRDLSRATLEAEGHRVLLATSGDEAVECFERDHPGCILLTACVPGVDGPSACKQAEAASSRSCS